MAVKHLGLRIELVRSVALLGKGLIRAGVMQDVAVSAWFYRQLILPSCPVHVTPSRC